MIVGSVEIRSLLYEISEVFRSILMIKLQGEKTRLVDLPDHEIKKLVELSRGMGLAQLNTLSKEFSTIEKELTYSINKRLVLESTLVRCTARLQQKK
jgi:DNA polymerase III gamma/tau subunit